MAKKGAQKTNLEANEIFLQYEEEIVNDPVYADMPDLRHDDGTIQWEAPSNRGSGVFQFSHDKRYQWWINKASEVGINTSEDKWISKVAKKKYTLQNCTPAKFVAELWIFATAIYPQIL